MHLRHPAHAQTLRHGIRSHDWRQRAGLQMVETAWQQLSGQITQLSSARQELTRVTAVGRQAHHHRA